MLKVRGGGQCVTSHVTCLLTLCIFAELEAEAGAPQVRRLKLSQPEVNFCTYMMDKYGDDYKVNPLFMTFWL